MFTVRRHVQKPSESSCHIFCKLQNLLLQHCLVRDSLCVLSQCLHNANSNSNLTFIALNLHHKTGSKVNHPRDEYLKISFSRGGIH